MYQLHLFLWCLFVLNHTSSTFVTIKSVERITSLMFSWKWMKLYFILKPSNWYTVVTISNSFHNLKKTFFMCYCTKKCYQELHEENDTVKWNGLETFSGVGAAEWNEWMYFLVTTLYILSFFLTINSPEQSFSAEATTEFKWKTVDPNFQKMALMHYEVEINYLYKKKK